MASRVHTYDGLQVIQRPGAPKFYLLSVAAAELLEWCDVPRAKGNYMAGYQRTLEEKRTKTLTAYLEQSEKNIVPGAVIVAVDEEYTDLEEISSGLFRITVKEDTRSFKDKLDELFGSFTTRLSDDELKSAKIEFSSAAADEEDDELSDTEYPRSYLAVLAAELQTALTDWDSLSQKRRDAIENYIEGVSKPGLIIDGQHRVFGAKNVSEVDVSLPVVLLPGLEYAEQVFQFYVLNSKAKPLKPTELRRIVSTSLTDEEIEDLYHRFRKAGIDAEEARWTYEMNTRIDSPFRDRIDFGYGEHGAVIKENVADQLVRKFMKASEKGRYRQLIKPLGDRWADVEKRFEIFFWFWSAVRDQYRNTWEQAEETADSGDLHQMFMKVSLLTLQSFILDRFVTALPFRAAGAEPPLSSESEVRSMVSSVLVNLPGEFFDETWKMKQIDTTEGRKALYESMEHVWNQEGKIHRKLKLFAG